MGHKKMGVFPLLGSNPLPASCGPYPGRFVDLDQCDAEVVKLWSPNVVDLCTGTGKSSISQLRPDTEVVKALLHLITKIYQVV